MNSTKNSPSDASIEASTSSVSVNQSGRGANRPEIRRVIIVRTWQMTTCGWLLGSSTHRINKKGLMWLEELRIEHIFD